MVKKAPKKVKKGKGQEHVTARVNGRQGNSANLPQNVNRSEQNGRGTV